MSMPCILFSAAQFPTDQDSFEADDCDANRLAGLAEWLGGSVPHLFVLLIGSQARPAPLTTYERPQDKEAQDAHVLVAPLDAARARWQSWLAQVRAQRPDWASQYASDLTHIDSLLAQTPYPWLVLDVWGSQPAAAHRKRAWAAWLAGLQAQAAQMEQTLAQGDAGCTSNGPLQALLDDWPRQSGWWSPSVVARMWAIDEQPLHTIAGLQDYELAEDAERLSLGLSPQAWLPSVPAYVVRRKDGQPRRDPVGVVTPYGRWLIGLDAGMNAIDVGHDRQWVQWGWLVAQRQEGTDAHGHYQRLHCRVYDLNGQAVTALLADTLLTFCSPAVAIVGPYENLATQENGHATGPEAHNRFRLIHMPGQHTLIDQVQSHWDPDDGMVHFSRRVPNPFPARRLKEPWEESYGVLDAQGRTLVEPGRYSQISPFRKDKKIAAVQRWRTDSERANKGEHDDLYGFINDQGHEIIACDYVGVVPAFYGDAPPKVFAKDRLLLLDQQGHLCIFKTSGERVCATAYAPTEVFLRKPLIDELMWLSDGQDVCLVNLDGVLVRREMSLAQFEKMVRDANQASAPATDADDSPDADDG